MRYTPATGQNVVHDLSAHTPSVGTVVPVCPTPGAQMFGGNFANTVVLGTQSGFALYDLETKVFDACPSNGPSSPALAPPHQPWPLPSGDR